MFDNPLDALTTAASVAIGVGTGNPWLAAGLNAGLAGGQSLASGAGPVAALEAAGTSAAGSAIGAGAGNLGGTIGSEVGGEVGKDVGKFIAPLAANAAIGAARGQSPTELGIGALKGAAMGGIKSVMNGTETIPTNPDPTGQYTMTQRQGYSEGTYVYSGDNDYTDSYPMPPDYVPPPDPTLWDDVKGWWKDNKSWAAPVGIVAATGAMTSLGNLLSNKKPPGKLSREDLQKMYPRGMPNANWGVSTPPIGYNPGISPTWNYFPNNQTYFSTGGRVGYEDGGEVEGGMSNDVGMGDKGSNEVSSSLGSDADSGGGFFSGIGGLLNGIGDRLNIHGNTNPGPGEFNAGNVEPYVGYQGYNSSAPLPTPVTNNPVKTDMFGRPIPVFAGGGSVGKGIDSLNNNVSATENTINSNRIMAEAESALNGDHPYAGNAIERFRHNFGQDALATLIDKARMGDGLSDSLPATINGRKEAALSSAEYVIPSDVVSHLGNGSSQAGARELDLMLDRVRKARTGTTKQAPGIRARGLLPG